MRDGVVAGRVQTQASSSLVFPPGIGGLLGEAPPPPGAAAWAPRRRRRWWRATQEPEPHGLNGGLRLPGFRIKWAGPSVQPCVGMRTLLWRDERQLLTDVLMFYVIFI